MKKLQVGKEYLISHLRKGMFNIRVTYSDEEFTQGLVTSGHVSSIIPCDSREVGESVSMRNSLFAFKILET